MLGRRISRFLLDKGWDLLISGRNINKLEELRDLLNKGANKKVDFFAFDLEDENEFKNLDDKLISMGFNITHLVNNARSIDNLEVKKKLKFIGRNPSASPATGYAKRHAKQQKEIIDKILK